MRGRRGGAATSAFGGRGAVTFLSKIAAFCAALFFLTSLGLTFAGMQSSVAAWLAEKAAGTPPAAAAAVDAGVVVEPTVEVPAGSAATGEGTAAPATEAAAGDAGAVAPVAPAE